MRHFTIRAERTRMLLLALLASGSTAMGEEPVISPGWMVKTYCQVVDPVTIAYAGSGVLYVGRDNSGSGGGGEDAVRIHRVSNNGKTVEEFGNLAVMDPDAVGFDKLGLVTGVPGAVVIGGAGTLWMVTPEGVVSELLTLEPPLSDPTQIAFDSAGRLFMSDGGGALAASDDVWGLVVLDAGVPGAAGVAVRSDGSVACADGSGVIRLYSPEGVLIDPAFSDLGESCTLASEVSNIYAATRSGGLLLITKSGDVVEIARGLTEHLAGIARSGGDIYLSDFAGDRVLRVRSCYPNCETDAQLDLFDFICFVNKFNGQDRYADCTGDKVLDLFDFLCFIGSYNAGC